MSDPLSRSAGQKFLKICGDIGTVATLVGIVMGIVFYALSMPPTVLAFCAGVVFLGVSMAVVARAFVSNEDPFSTIGDWRKDYAPPVLKGAGHGESLLRNNRQDVPKEPAKHGMVCLDTYVILFEFDGETPVKANKRGDKTFDGAVAEFVNSPDAQGWVPGVDFLEAQITFLNLEGEFCHRVGDCWWLGQDVGYVKELKSGGRAKLIIAFQMDDQVFAAEQINKQGTTELYLLEQDFYRVQVYLNHGKSASIFDLTPKPLKIEKAGLKKPLSLQSNSLPKKDYLEIALKLTSYMEEGHALLQQETDSSWWEAEVKTYIEETLGKFEALEWSKLFPVTAYPRAAIHRDRVDRTFTLLQRLGEIVTRLRT